MCEMPVWLGPLVVAGVLLAACVGWHMGREWEPTTRWTVADCQSLQAKIERAATQGPGVFVEVTVGEIAALRHLGHDGLRSLLNMRGD